MNAHTLPGFRKDPLSCGNFPKISGDLSSNLNRLAKALILFTQNC